MVGIRVCKAGRLPLGLFGRCYSSSDSLQAVKMDYALYQRPHSQLKNPPILIFHGLNLSRASWRRIARNLTNLGPRRVIAVDARNHGNSPHAPDHTAAHMAADVEAFMAQHKLNRIVALGHSIGGRALMTLALTKPELVERAIFVDVTPGPLPDEVSKAFNLFSKMESVVHKIPQSMCLAEGRKFIIPEIGKLVKNDFDLLMVVQNLKKLESGCFAWNVNTKAILQDWNKLMVDYEKTLTGLNPYPGETLLIAANRERFVTPENIEIMKNYFPKLNVKHLDADHQVYLDQPREFVNLVVNFTRPCTGC